MNNLTKFRLTEKMGKEYFDADEQQHEAAGECGLQPSGDDLAEADASQVAHHAEQDGHRANHHKG